MERAREKHTPQMQDNEYIPKPGLETLGKFWIIELQEAKYINSRFLKKFADDLC